MGIEGINIRHYRASGILIEFGFGHRVVNNRINNMLEHGVEVVSSRGNLIWKNEISYCYDGVLLISGSTNNWVIENVASRCYGDGFESFLAPDSNNAFISNKSIRNRNNGLEMYGSNNLAFNNLILDNGIGVIISQERDSVFIGNKVKGTILGTHVIFEEYTNYFAGGNKIVCNREEGIENNNGQFGIFIDNEISYNGDSGILFGEESSENLVMNNKLVCNVPDNISNRGTNNSIINNTDKPCDPCESPSDVCDAFSDEEGNIIDESKVGVN
ncbi:MAG: right-handed parallel beta-helix repeat-containing protein [Clostridiales bacterium]|nr:right-handed parallel beta-helix repeat-containing protein [Clostridiales bacterium]